MGYVGDIQDIGVREALQALVGTVIGEAIQPDKTVRYANGRMNRPGERGGEGHEWLGSTDGKHWLALAKLTGVINPATILAVANDPRLNGYDGKPARDVA